MTTELKKDQENMTQSANSSSGSATGSYRNKVALKPGHSLMDWIRLGHSGKDLTGVGGKLLKVTYDELQRHNKVSDAWICLKGNIYNVSHYMDYHPGGVCELMKGVGTDATKLFNDTHQWVNYESMLQKCLVGQIVGRPMTKKNRSYLPHFKIKLKANNVNDDVQNPLFKGDVEGKPLNGFRSCILSAKHSVIYNTKLFEIKLPEGVSLNIPVGHHIQVKAKIDDVEVTRNYTPIVPNLDSNLRSPNYDSHIYLMIKIYENGALTPYLDSVNLGGEIELNLQTLGIFEISNLRNFKNHFMLAAGTGLTPMIRLILFLLDTPLNTDLTVKLIFFNRDERDILWRDELDKLAKTDLRFEVANVLSEPHENWEGRKGRINKVLLEDLLTLPVSENDFCYVCGSTDFSEETKRILTEVQVPNSQMHIFS